MVNKSNLAQRNQLPLFGSSPEPQKPSASSKVEYDFPSGDWNGIVLVGEAPGAEEVRLGHPFVGRSGQLLGKILERAKLERSRCLIANTFRFQPPGNKVDHFFISRRAARQQGIGIAEEYGPFGSAFCRAEFAPEIAHLQAVLECFKNGIHARNPPSPAELRSATLSPHRGEREGTQRVALGRVRGELPIDSNHRKMIIVALGRTPLWALTGENGLLQKVGQALPCRLLPGIEVIPTFHPSFILRGNWALQDKWLEHFLSLGKYIE